MSGRRVVALVAAREIRERVRSKAFIVSTVISLLLLGAVAGVASTVAGDDEATTYDVAFVGAEGDDLAAAAARLVAPLDGVIELDVREVADVAEARALVEDGELDAAVEGRRVIVDEEIDDALLGLLQAASIDASFAELDLGAEPLVVDAIDPRDDAAEEREAIAFLGTILLYAQLLGFGYWVASGIVEEKGSRVVEVLLAKCRPAPLLAGKIIGIGVVGFAQLLSFVGLGLSIGVLTGAIELPAGTVALAAGILLWFVLGFAFYACLFAVGGAVASRPEELQSTTGPLTIVAVVSLFVAMSAGGDPSGTVARVASFVPFSAPMVLPIRSAAGEAAWWELVLGGATVVASIAVVVPLAGRIYAGGALFTKGQMKLGEALRAGRG